MGNITFEMQKMRDEERKKQHRQTTKTLTGAIRPRESGITHAEPTVAGRVLRAIAAGGAFTEVFLMNNNKK